VGLDVGDATTRSGEVAWKVDLPKKITKGRRGGVAFLSERARSALRDYLAAKRIIGESMAQAAPLFKSSQTRRLRESPDHHCLHPRQRRGAVF
jgi:site-specific recombinase XerD